MLDEELDRICGLGLGERVHRRVQLLRHVVFLKVLEHRRGRARVAILESSRARRAVCSGELRPCERVRRAQLRDERGDVTQRQSDLICRVALAQCRGSLELHAAAVLALPAERIEIDGNRERDAQLVGARVATADARAALIDLVRKAVQREVVAQLGEHVAVLRDDARVERQDEHLVRRDLRGKSKHPRLLLALALGFRRRAHVESVLIHSCENPVDAKGRLDHIRRVHLDVLLLLPRLTFEQFAGYIEIIAANSDADRALLHRRRR
mmetsp:Transcript_53003/g.121727  ORF Transcript_53003/g.121727 Transcript_53003/m.121727 type:complete len:267 (+) Transcript_53003:459-1259(+)